MKLPIAIATTATERAARRRRARLAICTGLVTTAVLLAGLCVAPVPQWCLDVAGAPRARVERLGGLRARWLAPETDPDAAELQRRLARRGLTATVHTYGPLVTAEIPGMPEVDTRDALQLLRGPAVEIHKLGPGGALDCRVLFDRTQIREAIVTSIVTGEPHVTFMLWTPGGSTSGPRVPDTRVAITVDHEVRWTAQQWQLFGDVFLFDSDGPDLAAALDGDPLHGGTIVDVVYVPTPDLAPFAWAARAAVAITGGAAAALIGLLLSACSARLRRRRDADAIRAGATSRTSWRASPTPPPRSCTRRLMPPGPAVAANAPPSWCSMVSFSDVPGSMIVPAPFEAAADRALERLRAPDGPLARFRRWLLQRPAPRPATDEFR